MVAYAPGLENNPPLACRVHSSLLGYISNIEEDALSIGHDRPMQLTKRKDNAF